MKELVNMMDALVFLVFRKSPYKMSFAANLILCGFASDLPLKKSKKFDEIFTFWPNLDAFGVRSTPQQ